MGAASQCWHSCAVHTIRHLSAYNWYDSEVSSTPKSVLSKELMPLYLQIHRRHLRPRVHFHSAVHCALEETANGEPSHCDANRLTRRHNTARRSQSTRSNCAQLRVAPLLRFHSAQNNMQ